MGVVIRSPRLRHELARRGWCNYDLARAAGISAPTVSAAMAGRPLSPKTVRLIARALCSAPALDGIDALLPGESLQPPLRSGKVMTTRHS
jgi:hypothetical protein